MADGVKVCFTVKNTGKVPAAVVPQVYVAPENPAVIRPHHELKGYDKAVLAKGQSVTFSIVVPEEAFGRYDIAAHDWVVDKGSYKILVGDSSLDIRLVLPVKL